MNKKFTVPLSINGYALAFLFLVATLFIGIGWYALTSMEQARLQIQENNRLAAEQELNQSVQNLVNSMNELSTDISSWDELFQQLAQPHYYSYWREHRMFNSNVLPDFVLFAEVFNAHGHALAVISDSEFPAQIEVSELDPFIEFKKDQIFLVIYLPISRGTPGGQVSGYMGLRLLFLENLLKNTRFRHLDAETLKINPTLTKQISVADITNLMNYRLQPNLEVESMMEILRDSVIQLAAIIGFLCLLFYLLMVFLLGKPLKEISDFIDRLRYSDPGTLSTNSGYLFPVAELEKVKNSLNQYHTDLQKAHGDLDEKNKELWKLAHHDSLTGMLNRRAFEAEWNESKQFLANHRVGIALILFDVNHFKAINDSYGHQVGDQVLKAISSCIQQTLRKKENLFRIGGDEFAAIIVGSDAQDELALAQRCINTVRDYDFSSMGIRESVRISCGIAHCQASELERMENLLWQADVAVYQAKRPGVTRPVLFTDDMADGSEAVFSSWMNNAVYEAAVKGTGLEIHYQPIVETKSREVAYYEALARINYEGDTIPPSNIFPIVTLRHMETEFDRSIILKVLEDLESSFMVKGSGISINLSAESVVHPDLVEWLLPLSDYLQSYNIILEVTETSLISQLSAADGNLKMLRKLGFKVALDDFGSGYSSLRYLTGMPVDTIKFDISLIQGMTDKRLYKLVEELAHMLIDLGYDLVAEGIEDEALMDKVISSGFKYSQGYLFGKPLRHVS